MNTIERKLKNTLCIGSLLVLLALFYANDFGITSRIDNLQISEEDYTALKETRIESNLEHTFQLTVDGYTLPYDETTDAFMYSIKDLESLEDYNPVVEIVMNESNLNYEIALLEHPLTEEAIQENEPAKLLIYSEERYDEYDIHLTTLPVFTLSLEGHLDEERPIGDLDQLGSMSLYNSEETIESDLYIRLRGATSRRFPKNQYRINLREFTIGGDEKLNHQSLLGMREDDDWILYSPYNDPEKVRNTLSNNLWHDVMGEENRFGINTGTEGKYVEVFINNRYWGLYTLMHPIDAKQLDLDLENNAEESEIHYRSISNKEIDWTVFEESTGFEKILGRFELRDPDDPFGQPEQWTPLYEHMNMQTKDRETLEHYLFNRTDIENQLNYYLFYVLLQATDNNFKNHNYISKLDEDTRIMLESPWDLDLTWGLRYHPQDPKMAIVKGESSENPHPSATLIHTALRRGSEEIAQRLKDKYQALRADEWSDEAFMERLDEYEKDIYHSGAILRDKERWPDTAYNENMDHLRNYILERLKATDDYIENNL